MVLSSQDLYRAFASLQHGELTDPVPIDEAAPVRADRYPYPDREPEYSNAGCGGGGAGAQTLACSACL